MYGKLKAVGGNADVVVDHNNDTLRFPDRNVTMPVKQMEAQSRWLATFLSSATGDSVSVESILAIPGWNVTNRIGGSSVFVINPTKPKRFFAHKNRRVLSAPQIQRVAHQLEQLCRDIEPAIPKQ